MQTAETPPRRHSLYRRFLARILVTLVLPMLAILLFIMVRSSQTSMRLGQATGRQMLTQMTLLVRTRKQEVEDTVSNMISYRGLLDFLSRPYSGEYSLASYRELADSYMVYYTGVESTKYRLFIENATIPMGFGTFYPLADISDYTQVAEFLSSPEQDIWLEGAKLTGEGGHLFTLDASSYLYLRKIFQPSGTFSGLAAAVTPRPYFIYLPDEYEGSRQLYLPDSSTMVINLCSRRFSAQELSGLAGTQGVRFRNALVAQGQVEGFPLHLVVLSEHDRAASFYLVVLLLMAAFFLLSSWQLIRFIQQIFRRLGGYIGCINPVITSGGFAERLVTEEENELSDVANNINLLLERINALMEKTMRQEVQSRESRFLALQHQINPHFIYNTMEVFSSQMEQNGLYEESEAMVAFARMFRYNISGDAKFAPVREELEQVRSYLSIQRICHSDIELQCAVDGEVQEEKLLRFSLQPIVENSVLHGLREDGGRLKIFISALRLEGELLFEIYDNGQGIRPQEMQRLNEAFRRAESGPETDSPAPEPGSPGPENGIGLMNINARMKLFYGPGYGLQVDSVPEEWTLVSFRIPLQPNG